jgi:uncharacterized repeat protein (TIGR03803 family)
MSHKSALFISHFAAAFLLISTFCTLPALASTEKILHAFTAFPNGDSPSQLVPDAAGNFYGVALGGRYAAGVVYRLVPQSNGKVIETVLYNFTGGLDGNYPTGIVLDSKGNIYGFTEGGGANQIGTFFELTPTKSGEWKETVLYNFADTGIAYQFNAAPSLDQRGNFFGQTYDWGPTYGYVFELVQSKGIWSEKIIHTFTGGADGGDSFGQFAFDDAGNLYGTGLVGGASKHGVVFELSPSGSTWTEQVIYNFTGGTDGASPEAGVIFDKQGNLYGTTDEGGT